MKKLTTVVLTMMFVIGSSAQARSGNPWPLSPSPKPEAHPSCNPPGRDGNPRVFPPWSRPYGLTYGQWSAKWWQFVFSIPATNNPLFFDDKCDVGQSGPVWYLTYKFSLDGSFQTVTRDCTVPAGKALFFPIANAEWDNLGIDPPWTTDQLRQLAKAGQDACTSMTCEVDGVAIDGLAPASNSTYRVTSPVFDYTIPDDNLFQFFGYSFGAQTVPGAVADGVFLMLPPLRVGQHVIHFTAAFSYGGGYDITYNLTVAP